MPELTLTHEQRAVVDHEGGLLRISGGAGTGRTTALVARYLRLVGDVPASSVVVLCPTRAAADRFLAAVLPHLAGGFDALPVTTIWGLAHSLVSRHGDPPTLLVGAEQREEVARLLAADGPVRWPSSPQLLGRRAFTDEVAGAVDGLQASPLADHEVLARAEARGPEERSRWADLLRFTARYRSALRDRNLIDAAGLLAGARRLLERPGQAADHAARITHVLVDDADGFDPAAAHLVAGLVAVGAGVAVSISAGADGADAAQWAPVEQGPVADIRLTRAFRSPPAPSLVTCTHPAVEPEAVVGELLAASDDGVPWSHMAVLVRHPGGYRARAVARALDRHGIPTTPLPGDAGPGDEPVARAVLDVLRWVDGDGDALDRVVASPVAGLDPAQVRRVRRETITAGVPLEAHPQLSALADLRHDLVARAARSTPAELAFEVWRRALGHLADPTAGDDPLGTGEADRALDALVGFLDGLARRAERRPSERLSSFLAAYDDGGGAPAIDRWRADAATARSVGDAVTVTSIARARGREWHTVVVAGCVEGELPRIRARPRLFDRALLDSDEPPTAPERRRQALADERALFDLACTRATGRLLATAAPEPGVLLSRFVEGWPAAGVHLPLTPGPVGAPRRPTISDVPPSPDGRLRLSASQLATYDDCPLRYYYEYVVGARTDAGPHAALGSVVHEVLATFLDPAPDDSDDAGGATSRLRTKDRLLALAEERWRDDIAPFRPQVEEARRDYFAMLNAWWDAEGADCPEVLAVERGFEVDVGPHHLTGFIDRIDRADTVDALDGKIDGIRIVDYKTGKKEPAADAVNDDLQLAVYHLAATRDPELAALGPPTQLRLLYVRRMHRFDQEVRPDHEATTEARVLATADRILAEEFEPSVDANCRLCSFQRVCPLQPEGRTTGPEAR